MEEGHEKYQTLDKGHSLHRHLREPIQEGPNAPNEFDPRHMTIGISQPPQLFSI